MSFKNLQEPKLNVFGKNNSVPGEFHLTARTWYQEMQATVMQQCNVRGMQSTMLSLLQSNHVLSLQLHDNLSLTNTTVIAQVATIL